MTEERLAPGVGELINLWYEIEITKEFLERMRSGSAEAGLPPNQSFKDMTTEDAAAWKELMIEWQAQHDH